MTSQQMLRVRELFAAAREVPAGERASWLGSQCDDPAVRNEVLSLLTHDGQGEFLTRSPVAIDLGEVAEKRHEPHKLPESIGPYRILSLLGEGGMGAVYEAEQQNPRRLVALKVLQSVRLTTSLRLRFNHEAELLARLEHPGIARIYEAGTVRTHTGPLPYFAMELVRGVPLTQYAQTRRLSSAQRLRLLAEVCDAVQHAHQRGVIHRDLKPANILVDDSGRPKILDFGVARTVNNDIANITLHTNTGQLIGTLPYMSPEQAAGKVNEIDTRCDVYALGVIAYELLCGELPYHLRDRVLHDAVRVICEETPTRLSSRDAALSGDVETIVNKALEKEKDRRYASAGELAADIRRYLTAEPISARPASAWYQFSRFARRNKVLVAGLAATFAALVIGIVMTLLQKRQAQRALELAEQTQEFMIGNLQQLNPEFGIEGKVDPVAFLDRCAAEVDSLQPATQASVLEVLAKLYNEWGYSPSALPLARRAVEKNRAILGAKDPQTLRSQVTLGRTLGELNQFTEAEALLRPTIDSLLQLQGSHNPITTTAIEALAVALEDQSKLHEAMECYRRVIDARDQIAGDEDEEPRSLDNMANVLLKLGRKDDARLFALQARDRAESQLQKSPRVARYLNNLALTLEKIGELSAAEQMLRRSLEVRQATLGPGDINTASAAGNLVRFLREHGRVEDALPVAKVLYDSRAESPLGPVDGARAAALYGLCLAELSRWDEAEPALREAWRLIDETGQRDQRPTGVAVRDALITRYEQTGRAADAALLRGLRD